MTKTKKPTKTSPTPADKHQSLAKKLDIKLQFNPRNAFELQITVPAKVIKTYQEKALQNLAKDKTLKGFRKGKAPLSLVKSQISNEDLKQATLSLLIPDSYIAGLTEHKLMPIMDPQLTVLNTDKKDWHLTFVSCTKPNIKLNDYKAKLKTASFKSSEKIWTPKDGSPEKPPENSQETRQEKLNQAIQIILTQIEVELPEMIVDKEANKSLTNLIDQTTKLGMSIDSYAQSKSTTVDEIKKNTRKEAETSLKLEFALSAIAKDLNITVTDQELTELWAKSAPQAPAPATPQQKNYLHSVITRQKTLDELVNLMGN